ncbi:MAG: DUF2189 domain-containing protein [Rhodospirillales bacterium]|nr:DUF2189 domain-containing protein [Rhodospirillales bacterium]
MTIKSPPEWGWDQLKLVASGLGGANPDEIWPAAARRGTPSVRRIGLQDLRGALREGLTDFAANRTDVAFLCLIYPVIGLVAARLAGHHLLPLLFPLAAGFALVGPLAAIGLYEISRRREQGKDPTWIDALSVVRSPAIGSIAYLGVVLVAIYTLWLLAANAIYRETLGPELPLSFMGFVHDVTTTEAGWTMIAIGIGVGFIFAVVVLAISVVSFPVLLDRNVGVGTAIATSLRAVAANPGPMLAWGFLVTAGLVLGTIPFFLGLIVVLPVLGHATWHLYRRVVA